MNSRIIRIHLIFPNCHFTKCTFIPDLSCIHDIHMFCKIVFCCWSFFIFQFSTSSTFIFYFSSVFTSSKLSNLSTIPCMSVSYWRYRGWCRSRSWLWGRSRSWCRFITYFLIRIFYYFIYNCFFFLFLSFPLNPNQEGAVCICPFDLLLLVRPNL